VEFTNQQLQQCVDAKKITNITTNGKSVADLLLEYINQRVAPLNLYNNTDDEDSIEVLLTTVALLHRVMDTNNVFREYLRSLPNATRKHEYYYVNGYYLASERSRTRTWSGCGT
jgi:hypothetical protein